MMQKSNSRGHILVAKVGLDGHDRGAKVLCRLLSDQGFEVTYLGVRSTAERVADVARDENADVVAISLLSGAHVEAAAMVRAALDARGLSHVTVAMGGLIPQCDAEALRAVGVARCFHPGQDMNAPSLVADAMEELVQQTRSAAPADLQSPS